MVRKIVVAAIPMALLASAVPVLASPEPPLGAIRSAWTPPVDLPVDQIIAQSSPALAMIDGSASDPKPAVVVGDRIGRLHAVDLATGRDRVLYSSSIPIDAPPSAAPVGPGALDTVFFGRGNQAIACQGPDGAWGGYTAVRADGTVLWKAKVNNPPGDTSCAHNGVMAGMALVTIKGALSVVGMSLGQAEHGFVAATGAPLAGWNPWFQADSSTSTVAVARLNGPTGQPSLIEGGDSTQGNAYGVQYANGGHVRIIRAQGNKGTPGSNGLTCSFNTYAQGGQIVAASPAVGGFLSGGATGIASGQGYFAPYGGPVNRLWVLNTSCQKVWSAKTDFLTSSPIVVDVNGDGKLDVVVGTQDVSTGGSTANGSVYAFDGATGRLLWRTATGSVVGSLAAADLRGTGHADVVVPTVDGGHGGLQILDGADGNQLWSTSEAVSQGTPLITADPGGTIGITLAGYHGVLVNHEVRLAGTIRHFTIDGSSAENLAHPLTSWLEFHHDPKLSGNVAGPLP
jgi:hypothetical protein